MMDRAVARVPEEMMMARPVRPVKAAAVHPHLRGVVAQVPGMVRPRLRRRRCLQRRRTEKKSHENGGTG